MNESQRKTLTIGLFVLAAILFLIGVSNENGTVALVLPTVCVFGAIYVRNGRIKKKTFAENFADTCLLETKSSITDFILKNSAEYEANEAEELKIFFQRRTHYYDRLRPEIIEKVGALFSPAELESWTDFPKAEICSQVLRKYAELRAQTEDIWKSPTEIIFEEFENRWKV